MATTGPSKLKLLILGGYGTFGGRLAELLCTEPALSLVIAGRSKAKAAAFCAGLPAGADRVAVALDRTTDISQRLAEIAPDILVDASGPFQAYGDDPYSVVKAAMAAGVHYLDLADASAFVRGITEFDFAAKTNDLVVLSGVSSFPVLTAAVVRELARDLEHVDSIVGGIAPSPYAGVGLNVIRAIAGYAGKPIPMRKNGVASVGYGLAETRRYTIAPPGFVPLIPLTYSLVDVPDLELLTDTWPQVRNVWMGAGPVPASLHLMLRWFAKAVQWHLIPTIAPLARLIFRTINVLRWGEHRGGMFIEVEGRNAANISVKRSWHLVAEGRDGPYIPSMAVEAIVRNWLVGKRPGVGARAATQELELADYRPLFARREIHVGQRRSNNDTNPYKRLLEDAWQTLPTSLKSLHGSEPRLRVTGRATITRGKGIVARIAALLFGFPKPATDVPVTVTFDRTGKAEKWTRDFDGQVFSSTLHEGRGRFERLLCERFGPLVFGMALVLQDGRLKLILRRWSAFGIPLPRALLPCGDSYEFEEEGQFNFHVEIVLPFAGPIVSYTGYLEQP